MMRSRCATPVNTAALSATSAVSVASKERISIRSFGFCAPICYAVQEGAAAARRRPLLARCRSRRRSRTTTSCIVAPSATAIGDREERDAALGVQRAVDRIDDDAPASVAELADLLGDDRDVESLEALQDDALRRRVDRRRVVAALAVRDDRLAFRASRQLREHASHIGRRVAADGEPVSQVDGTADPLVSFGKKYVVFCGITSPRRARSKTSSSGVGRMRNAPSASPRSTAATASSRSAVYVTSFGCAASTISTSSPSPVDELVPAVATVEHDAGQLVAGRVDHCVRARRSATAPTRCVGKIVSPSSSRRDEHDHHPRARLGAVLVVKGERGLVAVVPVGDQQLEVGEVRHARRPARAGRRRSPGPARGSGTSVRGAVVEEEDRLELRARRAQQPQAPLLRPRVRALVRKDDALVVRLDAQRRRRARCACARRRPGRRRTARAPRPTARSRTRISSSRHFRSSARRLVLGVRQRQVDDVVRAAREVLAPLLGRDDVVRRSDELVQRAGGLAVPLSAKWAHLGHAWTVP